MQKETYKKLEDNNIEVSYSKEIKETVTLARIEQEITALTQQKEEVENGLKLWQERKKEVGKLLKK